MGCNNYILLFSYNIKIIILLRLTHTNVDDDHFHYILMDFIVINTAEWFYGTRTFDGSNG